MIVLDTHAWIWDLTAPEELSGPSRAAIDRARHQRATFISAMSVWELFMLVKNGRLELTIGPETLLRRAERLSYLQFVGVDPHVAGRSVALPDIHGDPVDRLIVATAQELGCPLVSNDRRLRSYPDVEVIWQLPTSPGSKTLPSTNPSASAQPRRLNANRTVGRFAGWGCARVRQDRGRPVDLALAASGTKRIRHLAG